MQTHVDNISITILKVIMVVLVILVSLFSFCFKIVTGLTIEEYISLMAWKLVSYVVLTICMFLLYILHITLGVPMVENYEVNMLILFGFCFMGVCMSAALLNVLQAVPNSRALRSLRIALVCCGLWAVVHHYQWSTQLTCQQRVQFHVPYKINLKTERSVPVQRLDTFSMRWSLAPYAILAMVLSTVFSVLNARHRIMLANGILCMFLAYLWMVTQRTHVLKHVQLCNMSHHVVMVENLTAAMKA